MTRESSSPPLADRTPTTTTMFWPEWFPVGASGSPYPCVSALSLRAIPPDRDSLLHAHPIWDFSTSQAQRLRPWTTLGAVAVAIHWSMRRLTSNAMGAGDISRLAIRSSVLVPCERTICPGTSLAGQLEVEGGVQPWGRKPLDLSFRGSSFDNVIKELVFKRDRKLPSAGSTDVPEERRRLDWMPSPEAVVDGDLNICQRIKRLNPAQLMPADDSFCLSAAGALARARKVRSPWPRTGSNRRQKWHSKPAPAPVCPARARPIPTDSRGKTWR